MSLKKFFVRDPYYKNCKTVRDSNGKIIPIEVSPLPGQELIYSDWFMDQISEPESPEDSIIDSIDRGSLEPPETQSYKIGDQTIGAFTIEELVSKSLNKQERLIFDAIFVQSLTYRAAEKLLHKDHCFIFNEYNRIKIKLGKALLKRYKI